MRCLDRFEETAAVLEFDFGMTRFAAEAEAARRQGVQRWEALREVSKRDTQGGGDRPEPAQRHAKGNLPGVQPASKEQQGSLPECDVQAGRDRLALLALRA